MAKKGVKKDIANNAAKTFVDTEKYTLEGAVRKLKDGE